MELNGKNLLENILAGLITAILLWVFSAIFNSTSNYSPDDTIIQTETKNDGNNKNDLQSTEDVAESINNAKSKWAAKQREVQDIQELFYQVKNPLILFQIASMKHIITGTLFGIFSIIILRLLIGEEHKNSLAWGCSSIFTFPAYLMIPLTLSLLILSALFYSGLISAFSFYASMTISSFVSVIGSILLMAYLDHTR